MTGKRQKLLREAGGYLLFLAPAVILFLALEIVPVVLILAMIALQTVKSGAVLSYTEDTASALLTPSVYRDAVLSAPVVGPHEGMEQ